MFGIKATKNKRKSLKKRQKSLGKDEVPSSNLGSSSKAPEVVRFRELLFCPELWAVKHSASEGINGRKINIEKLRDFCLSVFSYYHILAQHSAFSPDGGEEEDEYRVYLKPSDEHEQRHQEL